MSEDPVSVRVSSTRPSTCRWSYASAAVTGSEAGGVSRVSDHDIDMPPGVGAMDGTGVQPMPMSAIRPSAPWLMEKVVPERVQTLPNWSVEVAPAASEVRWRAASQSATIVPSMPS